MERSASTLVIGALLLAACETTNASHDASSSHDATVVHDATPSDASPPDADNPYCHYDCFGHHACADGVVTTWVDAPIPCDDWTGSCPSYESYTCVRGCRMDVSEIGPWEEPSAMCEENRPKRAGDPCTVEEHCHPQVATVEPDGTVINVYLTCDTAAGVCVDRPPPVIPDYFAACDLHAPLPDNVPGTIQTGAVETTLCSGGACVYIEDSAETCIWQGCTASCDSDDDCPPGTLCRDYFYRGSFCLPPIGASFDWTCVP